MKRIKGNKWTFGGIAAVLIIAAAAGGYANAGIIVKTAEVERGMVVKLLKETGTVESRSTVVVTSKVSGEIRGLIAVEGHTVKAGDTLMMSGGTGITLDIKSRQAELTGLQVQYSQARELADKNRALYEQGALSYEGFHASDTAAKQLAAQIASLQYSIQSYAESSGAQGVAAPIDGVLTDVYVKEGETVAAGSPLFEISNLNDQYVRADFIAEDADLMKVGDAVIISNEDTGFIDNEGKVNKIYLKAENKMSDLGVNQKRVTVEIAFGTDQAIRLGSDVDLAVFEKDGSDCVYVMNHGKANLHQVKIGLKGEDYLEVLSGLSEGDQVILSPGADIADGVRVKTKN